MAGILSTGTKRSNTTNPPATAMRVQNSMYGKPMPIGWGRFRLAGNLIWYGDFLATFTPSAPAGGGGGKGGGGSGGGKSGNSGNGSYNYSAAVAIALTEGPVASVLGLWNQKTGQTLASLNLSSFVGDYGQAPWGYLTSGHAAIAEQHTIPTTAPYTVQTQFHNPFLADFGVTDSEDTVYTAVGSSPAVNQYSVSGGTYSFNGADAGLAITIRYTAGDQQPQNEGLSYRGTAYVAGTLALGSNPEMPNLTFEVAGALSQRTVTSNWTVAAPYSTVVAAAKDPAGTAYSQFVVDGGVTDAVGNVFAKVTANPGHRQYVLTTDASGATYGFAAADAGTALNITFTASGQDANPADVISDFLTNPYYGAGFPSARLSGLSTYSSYCQASGLMVSPLLTDARGANDFLKDLMTGTNAEFVWSGRQLTVVPYGDAALSANGATYTPPSTALYAIGDDDLLQNQASNPNSGSSAGSEDPVQVTRLRPSDQVNDLKVGWLDRANQYNPAIVEAKDDAAINQFGLRGADPAQMNFFANGAAAMMSAQLALGRQQVRNSYAFTVGQQFILLDPMDIVTVTDSTIGMSNAALRVREIAENQDGSLNLVCEDYLAGAGAAPLYGTQATAGYLPDYNAAAPAPNPPVIFEPPAALTGGDLEVWMALSGAAGWGGATVWLSTDGSSYSFAGEVQGAARQGVLTASLASVAGAPNPPTMDNTNTLSVDLAESGGQLLPGTTADAVAGNTVCWVGGELIAYTGATLVSGNAYTLTGLVRGMYDSQIGAHPAGSPITRLDGSLFILSFTADRIGSTVSLKVLPFNYWGGGAPSLAAVEPYAYTIQGTALAEDPANVTGLASAFIGGLAELTWTAVTDPRSVDYEIRLGASWAAGQVIGRTPLTQAPLLGDGNYWVAAHYAVPNGPDVYSPNPTGLAIAGSALVSNVIATRDQAGGSWGGQKINTLAAAGRLDVGTGGDMLGTPNLLTVGNLLGLDWINPAAAPTGAVYSGAYQIPATDRVDIGRVATCNVMISLGAVIGVNANASNWLAMSDLLSASDLIGNDIGNHAWAVPQIRLSQNGWSWSAWQNWVPGSYTARAFDCQVLLYSSDPAITTQLSNLVFSVDVPDRDDHYTGQLTDALTGLRTVTYTPDGSVTSAAFNGGPGASVLPAVQITVINPQPGDDQPQVVAQSAAGITIQTSAAGVPVARTLNLLVEGF